MITCQSFDVRVIELNQFTRKAKKLSLAAKRGESKILKRLRINPGNYRWNPLPANYADDRSYEHIRRWRHLTGYKFNANATDETKICQRVPFVRTILLLSLGAVISVPKLRLRLISRFGPCFYRFYSFDQSRDKPSALVKCCWCQKIYLNKQLCR